MCGPNVHCSIPYVQNVYERSHERKMYEVVGFCFSPELNSHYELMDKFFARHKQPAYTDFNVETIGFLSMGIRPDTGEFRRKRVPVPTGPAARKMIAETEKQARRIWDTHYPTLEKLGEWSRFMIREHLHSLLPNCSSTNLGLRRIHYPEWCEGLAKIAAPRVRDRILKPIEHWVEDSVPVKDVHQVVWDVVTKDPNEYWRDRIAHPPVAMN